MPGFRARLDEAEALLRQAQERPEGERLWLLAVVSELLGDLIADLDHEAPAAPCDSVISPPSAPVTPAHKPD
jgi:hypothetical protein